MAKAKKQTKRLGNVSFSNAGGAARKSGKKGQKGKNKSRKNVVDARSNIGRRQNAPRSSAAVARRGLGRGAIKDARQILNSQARGASRGVSSRSRVFTPTANTTAVMSHLTGPSTTDRNSFNQAVRSAIAPLLAPLLRNSARSAEPKSQVQISSARVSNGPCALRVANLAQSVTIGDLNDLFNSFPGYDGANFESGGIAIVNFKKRDSAAAALDEYNNRELDGRMMVIQLEPSPSGAASRLGPKH